MGLAAVLSLAGAMWPGWRRRRQERDLAAAKLAFHRQRERLEAKFFELSAASGKPRGLRWVDCDFSNAVSYARDRRSGELSAFVAVTISFEAVEGGGMEQVEAVSNLRAASAVFLHRRGKWQTEGRTVFNLSPSEAIEYYRQAVVRVAPDARVSP